MEERIFDGMNYLISYPEGFQEDKKYPLLIFLHGAGMRGETTEKLRNKSCINQFLRRQNARGYIFIAPHCKSGTWCEWMNTLIRLVETFRETPYIDVTRIYLTGNSMGGYGTWSLASLRSYWFAAAMPICGGGLAGLAMNLKHLPIRAFHGLRDTIVDPIESLQIVKSVNQFGGHAELILFPELEHNCWNTAYSDEKNFDWLFSFTASAEKPEVEDISRTYFG